MDLWIPSYEGVGIVATGKMKWKVVHVQTFEDTNPEF